MFTPARIASLVVAILLSVPALANDIANPSWTQNDAGNSAASPNGWTSGTMTPNQVEPTARAMMGATKRWFDHANPTVTSGGTANAQTLTYGTAPEAYRSGETYAFIAGATNTGAATLNVNALGAKAIQQSGAALTGAEIVVGRLVVVFYDGAAFQIAVRNLPLQALDWRDFGCSVGSSDNAACAQLALNAGYNYDLPVRFCGLGSFTALSAIYYFSGTDLYFCPGTVLKMGGVGGFAALAPATSPGHTFPTASLFNVHLRQVKVDMNLAASGGTGILMQATQVATIEAPIITNIPAKGTWTWTNDDGAGTLPNAGISLVGGPHANVENVTLSDALVGVFATGADYTTCPNVGGIGLAMTVPTSDANLANPANANIIRNSSFNCNNVGILNEYGSDNFFLLDDTTWSTEFGMVIGGYGHVEYAVTQPVVASVYQTSAGGKTICIKFATVSLTGSPISACHNTSAGETAHDVAAALVTTINGNANLTGSIFAIGAAIYGEVTGESVIKISYTDQSSSGLGIGINFEVTSTDNLSISWAHNVGENIVQQMQGEGTRYGMFYIGASALHQTLVDTGQMTNTPHLVYASYGGPFGAQNIEVAHWYANAQQHGTTVAASFVADPLNDPQPYLVNTSGGNVVVTMHGLLPCGTTISFADANESWGTHSVKPTAAATAYGTTNAPKVLGNAGATFSGLGSHFSMMNNCPDWIGGTTITATIP